MANGFDLRLISVEIQIGDKTKIYSSPFDIKASGMKYANGLQNDCQVTISNLDKETQDYLLTQTSPFNKNYSPKSVVIKAGRVSYGESIIYEGTIYEASMSQPPDIGITLRALTGNYLKGNMITRTMAGNIPLKLISEQIAKDLDYILDFQATDRNIPGYSYSGESLGQLTTLNSYGGISAFIDGGKLYVKDGIVPINGVITVVNANTGMIGTPEVTEQGIKVTFLLDQKTQLGGALRLTSKINPSLNGDYIIYRLGFQIATRDTPFYYIAECQRFGEQ